MSEIGRLRQIAQLARAVVSELDLEPVLSQVTAALRSLRPDVVCAIRLIDAEAGGYRLAGTGGFPAAGRIPVVPFGEGLTHVVAETRRPLLVLDNHDDPRAIQAHWSQDHGLTTYYGAPIEAAGELFGVVNMNFPPNAPPTEDEQTSIEVLAAQAAVAIRNARLFSELDERRRAAEALANVSRALAQTLDEPTVANRIVESVLPLLGVDSATLRQLRPDGALVALALAGRARAHFEPGHVIPPGVGLVGRAAAECRPIAADVLDESDVVFTDDLRHRITSAGIRAVLAIPLRVGSETLGVLALGDGRPRSFSRAEVVLLQAFADQAALALHNAQLLQQSKARQAQLEALLDITRELSAIPAKDSLLQTIAQTCGRILDSESVGFRLLEGDELVVAGTWADADQIVREPRIKIGDSLGGIVATTGEPLVVVHPAGDPRATPALREALARAGYKHWLGVPVKIGGRLVGVLSIRTRRDAGFSERDLTVATAFAAQGAVALETTRLHADAERRRQTAERLAEVGRLISGSLDLQDVAQRVVDNLRSLIPSLRTAFYRVDPISDDLLLVAASNDPTITIGPPIVYRRGTGIVGLARQERCLVVTPNVLTDSRFRLEPELRAYWASTAIRAVVAVPLLGASAILGVLSVADREGRTFSDEELRVLEMFAAQATVALDNARLYRQAVDAYRELSDTQAQLLQAGKLAAVGQLVAGVAHELNNPLAVVVGQAELLTHLGADPVVIGKAEKILRSAMRAARIVRELQIVARPQPMKRAAVQMSEIFDRVLALRQPTLEVSGILIERDVAPAVPEVDGDALQLEQVVLNLLLNAEQAATKSQSRARITLNVRCRGDHVQLSISDNGPGIPADVLPRIFEPFFTTKPVGHGTGLGLSICYRIVEAHGGRIWAESEPGRGATFIVELPGIPADRARATANVSPAATVQAGRVLVIDDEEDVAETLRVLLEVLSQEVTVATHGEQGWELLTAPSAAYNLVTLDLKMPGLSGPKLWERLVAARSPMVNRIAFVTGDTVDSDTQRFLAETGRPVLTKPFELRDVAELLATAVPSA